MSPIYDVECESCGIIEEVLCKMDEDRICPSCSKPMKRICNCTHFSLKYNNKTDMCDWSGNSSNYWNDVRKQRAEGKNVKACNEN